MLNQYQRLKVSAIITCDSFSALQGTAAITPQTDPTCTDRHQIKIRSGESCCKGRGLAPKYEQGDASDHQDPGWL